MIAYCSRLQPTSGGLQVLPGTHLPACKAQLEEFRRAWPREAGDGGEDEEQAWWPGAGISTEPGELIFSTFTSGMSRYTAAPGCSRASPT